VRIANLRLRGEAVNGRTRQVAAAREQFRAKLQRSLSLLRPDDDEVELRRRAGAWLAHVDRLATTTRQRWQDAADHAL